MENNVHVRVNGALRLLSKRTVHSRSHGSFQTFISSYRVPRVTVEKNVPLKFKVEANFAVSFSTRISTDPKMSNHPLKPWHTFFEHPCTEATRHSVQIYQYFSINLNICIRWVYLSYLSYLLFDTTLYRTNSLPNIYICKANGKF